MADCQIITEKELNYIETLYLYANLEEFINPSEFPEVDGYASYILMLQFVHDNLLHQGQYLNEANGRSWYKFDNYRLGIMEYDKAKRSNQFNIEIQYYQHHMFDVRDDISLLELPFDGLHSQYHIKRIDVTKIAKHQEDYLSNKGFISTYKSIDRKGSGTKTETVYLGHRKNGNVLRMYNKTVELLTNTKEHPIDYSKIALFSSYFKDIENLYTYELELHRKVLKEKLNIDTLADIDKAKKVYNSIVGKVRIYDDNEHNRGLILQKNRERIEAHNITIYEEYKRETVKRYPPSLDYLKKSINKQISKYMKSMEIEETDYERAKIYNYVMADQLNSDNYEIIIEYVQTEESIEYEQMKQKHERLRDGNDELQSEAVKAFGAIKTRRKQEDIQLSSDDAYRAKKARRKSGDNELFEQKEWKFEEVSNKHGKDGIKSEAKQQ